MTSANETYNVNNESPNHSIAGLLTYEEVYNTLYKLDPQKTPGPDDIPNWILRDYAVILAKPITSILNSCYKTNKFPASGSTPRMSFRYLSKINYKPS